VSRTRSHQRRIRRNPVVFSSSTSIEQLENRLLFSRLLGLDVSTYQPNVNWGSVYSAGKSFAFIRASYGISSTDDQFAHNTGSSGAQAKGLYSGFYHYAYYDYAGHTAIAEADNFWSVIAPKLVANGKTLMPMLDFEEPLPSGWSAQTMSNWINDFCNRIKSRAMSEKGLDITPVIYMNASTAGNSNKINSTVAMNWPLVVAQWPGGTVNTQSGQPSSTGFWQDWAFWQYADNGHVAGVGNGTTTNVDLDVFNGDSKVLQDFIVGSQGRWADGTWVQVNTSSGLKAWSDPTSNNLSPYNDTYSIIPNGTYGKILSGPVYGNGYMRWRIQYSNGVTGWSAEPFLISATPSIASNPNLPNGALTSSLSASFTWSATHASSYRVYLDNILQAVVNSASWSHPSLADGSHTWRIDTLNDGIVTTGTNWQFTLDSTPPTASFGGQSPATGSPAFSFTITYADATTALDASSLDDNDLTVTGLNGFTSGATFVSLSGNVATYQLAAPGGTWDISDNGIYTISQNTTQVRDIVGNWRNAGLIGTFTASADFAYLDGRTLHVDYAPSAGAVALGADSSGNLTVSEDQQTLAFSSGSFDSIVVDGAAQANAQVQVGAPLNKPLTLDAKPGNNLIELQAGASLTFASDAGATAPDLTLLVDPGASVLFAASQHLAGLSVQGTARVASGAGGPVVLTTRSLGVDGALDLFDGDLILDYSGTSPIGTWTGGAYSDISGMISRGYAGATGIYTSAADSARRLGIAEASSVLGLSGDQTALWQGETVDASSVLVKYTYAGDANLDGKVNIDDYGRIDANVGQSGSTFGWYNGDFNLDGKINIDDYGLIDSVIGAQGPPL
jgi:GH25 family lysozyme M1 (1,4-beta-N-acetylmuramidase)